MLKTLLKYEWKDTWPLGLACNVVAIVLSMIGVVILWGADLAHYNNLKMEKRVLMMTGIVGYVVIYIAMMFAVILIMRYFFFVRYYKNLFTDQGYLMHTLPVKSADLIHSKLIIALAWQYITGIVICGCIFILILALGGSLGELSAEDVVESFTSFDMEWDVFLKNIPVVIASVCIVILSPVLEILIMYVAVGIGQLVHKYKLLVSILLLIGYAIVKRFFSSIISLRMEFVMIASELPEQAQINIVSVLSIFVMAGAIVGLYFLNKFFVERKLNLE